MYGLADWRRTDAQAGNKSKVSHGVKPGLNNLTSCHLLDSLVLFYDCEGISCKLRPFFILPCQTSINIYTVLIHTNLFFHSHRWQWRVGLWRWDPLSLQWKPVRLTSCMVFIVAWPLKSEFKSFPLKDMIKCMCRRTYILIFCVSHSIVPSPCRLSHCPRCVSTFYIQSFLKWKPENRRCFFFPLLSAFWFSGCFMLCIDIWQIVTCLWCALLPCRFLTPHPPLLCLTVLA